MPLGYLLLIANIHKVVFVSYRGGWLLGVNIESPFPAQNKEARRGMTNFYGAVESRFAEGVMQTNTRSWCKPILVGGLTYIGRHRDLYSFVVGPI